MPRSNTRLLIAIQRRDQGYKWRAIAKELKYGSAGAVCTAVLRHMSKVLNDDQRRNKEAYELRTEKKWSYDRIAKYLGYDNAEQADNAIQGWKARLRREG